MVREDGWMGEDPPGSQKDDSVCTVRKKESCPPFSSLVGKGVVLGPVGLNFFLQD
jgi:hypothetical protein